MLEYSELSTRYKMYAPKLEEYKDVMAHWDDAPVGAKPYLDGVGSFADRNGHIFNNIERITLKDGQRAWKSDEGVFYPYIDGLIGGAKVPNDLIP